MLNCYLFRLSLKALTVLLVVGLTPIHAYAYIGPGAGITAIGTLIALVGAVVLAIVGFLWYPIKRMRAKRARKIEVRSEKIDGNTSEK